MSICRARLRNTSNAITLQMSGEQIQICLNCSRSQQLDPADDQAVNSRLLVRWQKVHQSQRNWQIITSGRLQMLATRNFRHCHTVVDEVAWSLVAKYHWVSS